MVEPSSDDASGDDDLPAAPALDLPPAEPPPNVPAGSLIDAILHNPTRPRSPTSPFKFPFSLPASPPRPSHHGSSVLNVATIPDFLSVMDSITRVAGSPRVFGLRKDSRSYVQVRKTSSSLIDGGANICLTGDLNILVTTTVPYYFITPIRNQWKNPPLVYCLYTSMGMLCYYSKNKVIHCKTPNPSTAHKPRNIFPSVCLIPSPEK